MNTLPNCDTNRPHFVRRMAASLPLRLAVLLLLTAASARGGLPVTGVSVPNLSAFDDIMQNFMADHGIDAGVLAVSRNGCIVYQRGFGIHVPTGNALAENTPMRIASVEKPITAAAIQMLVEFAGLGWNDFLFDLGQPGGGRLEYVPFGNLGDNRLDNITIEHAFNHQGGWDRDTAPVGDPQFSAIEIADAMGVASPPGRHNTIRYMLGEPLEFDPGGIGVVGCQGYPGYCYSNFGYMCLGRVIEELSGYSYLEFIRLNVLTPDMWVPSTEIFTGNSIAVTAREPYYDDGSSSTCTNVFDPDGPRVDCPYGSWEHQLFIGHGNLVVSAAPLLIYMDHYQVAVGGDSGAPLAGTNGNYGNHNGALAGTNTIMLQRGDGINIVVLFPARGDPHYASTVADEVSSLITAGGITWPTFCVDGFWVHIGAVVSSPVGSTNLPFPSFSSALSNTTAGSKIRFKSGGTTNWTGTINERLRLDSPYGTVRIGAQ